MSTLAVNEIYATVQGEGAQTGTPAVFIRLQGCAVGCGWCDTKHSWAREAGLEAATLAEANLTARRWCRLGVQAIVAHLRDAYPGLSSVVLTGGEPLEQDCAALVAALLERGYRVQIETSATAQPSFDTAGVWLTVSPKLNMPGGKPVLREVLRAADEIKHPVGKAADLQQLAALLETAGIVAGTVPVYLQPLSQSPRATQLCIDACLTQGYKLSIQTHKYLGLP